MDEERWRQISRVFHEARRHAEPERHAFLDAACKGDETLRLEVESLLAQPESPSILATSLTNRTGPINQASVPSPGQTLGGYRIDSLLGRGGMGMVFLAYDTTLRRSVALKVIDEGLGEDAGRSQVLREARNAAALNHPCICTIHEIGEADGLAFIAMEYVQGRSLRDQLDSGRLPIDEAIRNGIQVANALSHAHERGVIHRDLKAENLIVTASGALKIVDFGLARRRDPLTKADTTMASLPGFGIVAGTPYAMAPEQVRGESTDARTDMWAVGVLLHEMVAGEKPFRGATTPEIFSSILRDAPSRMPETVPLDVRTVVARCLEKMPDQRYQSASDLQTALEHIASGKQSATETPSWPGRTREQRRAITLAAMVLMLAILVGGWWVLFRSSPRIEPIRDPVVAVLPLRNLSGESQNDYLSAGITAVAISKLASLPGARVLSAGATAPYRDAADRVQRATRDLGATLVVDGSLQRAGDRLLITATLVNGQSQAVVWSDTFDAAVGEVFAIQQQLADGLTRGLQTAGALNAALSVRDRERIGEPLTKNTDAFANYAQGRSFLERPDVAGSLERAAGLLEAAIALDPRFALAHAALGETFWALYLRTREAAWVDKAREATLEALRLDPDQAGVRYSLAVIYNGTGKTSQAVDELRHAIALQPAADDAHRLLGEIVARTGSVDDGVAELRRAIEIRPSYWGNHWSLGLAYYNGGRYRDAIPAFQRVTELQPDNARGFQTLGTAFHQLGDLTSALANYERAIAISPTVGAYSNIGTLHYGREEFAEAARAYEKAIELDPKSWTAQRNAGDAYEALGRLDKARVFYLRAVELSREALAINPKDARALALKALCEAKLGLGVEAVRHVSEALAIAPADVEILYKKAVVCALTGDTQGAFKALADAIAHGYSASLVSSDRDWGALRSSADFQRLIGSR